MWMMTLGKDKMLTEFKKRSDDAPRQALDTYYRLNGAIYIRQIEYSADEICLKDDKEIAYIMDKKRSVDIDDAFDFAISEYLIKNIH